MGTTMDEQKRHASLRMSLRTSAKAMHLSNILTSQDIRKRITLRTDEAAQRLLFEWHQRICLEYERIRSEDLNNLTRSGLIAKAWIQLAYLRYELGQADHLGADIIYQLAENPLDSFPEIFLSCSGTQQSSVEILVNWAEVAMALADTYAEKQWWDLATDSIERVLVPIKEYVDNNPYVGLTPDGVKLYRSMSLLFLDKAIYRFNSLKAHHGLVDGNGDLCFPVLDTHELSSELSPINDLADNSLVLLKMVRQINGEADGELTSHEIKLQALLMDIYTVEGKSKQFMWATSQELPPIVQRVSEASRWAFYQVAQGYLVKVERFVENKAKLECEGEDDITYAQCCLKMYCDILDAENPLSVAAAPLFTHAYYKMFIAACESNQWEIARESGIKCMDMLQTMREFPHGYMTTALTERDHDQLTQFFRKVLPLVEQVAVYGQSAVNGASPTALPLRHPPRFSPTPPLSRKNSQAVNPRRPHSDTLPRIDGRTANRAVAAQDKSTLWK